MGQKGKRTIYASDIVWTKIKVLYEGKNIEVDLTANGFAGMIPVFNEFESAKKEAEHSVTPIIVG